MTSTIALLPTELLHQIFAYCDEGLNLRSLRVVCQKLKEVIDDLNKPRAHCRKFSHDVELLNEKLKKMDFPLIGDDLLDPRTKIVTPAEMRKYRRDIAYCRLSQLHRIFTAFKDNVIDALSDANACYRAQMSIEGLSQLWIPPAKEPNGFVYSDILTQAQHREVASVRITPYCVAVMGDAKTHVLALRCHGDYGTEGGLQASIGVFISNVNCPAWGSHPHPFFGESYIDMLLPGKLFLGKKEGDTVTFPLQGKEIRLICRGNTEGLPEFVGKFEELFERFTVHHHYIKTPDLFIPSLSKEKQSEMLQKLHDDYSNSLWQRALKMIE